MNKSIIAVFLAIISLSLVTSISAKEDIKPCVRFASTWDSGVEEAKLLNLPIVVHSHGFY